MDKSQGGELLSHERTLLADTTMFMWEGITAFVPATCFVHLDGHKYKIGRNQGEAVPMPV